MQVRRSVLIIVALFAVLPSVLANVGIFGSQVNGQTFESGEPITMENYVVNRNDTVKSGIDIVYEIRRVSDFSLVHQERTTHSFAPHEVKALNNTFEDLELANGEYFTIINILSGAGAPLASMRHEVTITGGSEPVVFTEPPYLKVFYEYQDGRTRYEYSYGQTGRPVPPGSTFQLMFALEAQNRDAVSYELFLEDSYGEATARNIKNGTISIEEDGTTNASIPLSLDDAGTYDLRVALKGEEGETMSTKEVRLVIMGAGGNIVDVFNKQDTYEAGETLAVETVYIGPADAVTIVPDVLLSMEVIKDGESLTRERYMIDELPRNPEEHTFRYTPSQSLEAYQVRITMEKNATIYDQVTLDYEPLEAEMVMSEDGRIYDPDANACFDDGECTQKEREIGNCMDCTRPSSVEEEQEEEPTNKTVSQPSEVREPRSQEQVMQILIVTLILGFIIIGAVFWKLGGQGGAQQHHKSKTKKNRKGTARLSLSIVLLFLAMVLAGLSAYADPSNPPPPPPPPPQPDTIYYYYLVDEFTDCGPENSQTIRYCDEYYTRQKFVTLNGKVISQSTKNVCGKDPRCPRGSACNRDNVNDNNQWQTETLDDDWYCPKGKAISHIHRPGNLDPNFDTVSMAAMPPLKDSGRSDMYFNAYIPACVNRIPMMNFNPQLKEQDGSVAQQKTGLYAKHETLSYDANPMGGRLENFDFPEQDAFRKTYTLSSELNAYRMWSFRERFVEGLQRTVQGENLQLPNGANPSALASNQPHDFEDLYLSRDFMLGAYQVNNVNNAPSGESLTQELTSQCNLDVNDLGINTISTAEDLEDAIDSGDKSQIITELNRQRDICDIEEDATVTDISFSEKLPQPSVAEDRETFTVDFRDLDRVPGSVENAVEFRSWANANTNYPRLTTSLQDLGEFSENNPEEEVKDVRDVQLTTSSKSLSISDVDELGISGVSNASAFVNHVQGLGGYDSLSEDLMDEGYLEDHELIESLQDVRATGNQSAELDVEVYGTQVSMDLEMYVTSDYEGNAGIKLTMDYQTSTESSWNWRSLQSLTLDQLGRCLYNWDQCLYQTRQESSMNWDAQEIADLGYGPRMNSIAYRQGRQMVESNYNIDFGYHFDGARGKETVDMKTTVYRDCQAGDRWVSSSGTYACANETVYKCHYGPSADELMFDLVEQASKGDALKYEDGLGLVCKDSPQGPVWQGLSCSG